MFACSKIFKNDDVTERINYESFKQRVAYNGKNYLVPVFETDKPCILMPQETVLSEDRADLQNPIIRSLNTPFDTREFSTVHRPISLGRIATPELIIFSQPDVQRVLDMPIKFPDCDEYRIPRALGQFAATIQRMIDFEYSINPELNDYFAYLTIDQGTVKADTLQREAPCHVDGFQGARWQPKVRGNHTYTVSDKIPTAYYLQPFDFSNLDESKHDFFWEMNAQVADTKEAYKWQPQDAEITLMDCYSVHRGTQARETTFRTWLRLSFEERSRVFDRLGNAHNPLFDYDWAMVERDIEQLRLVPFRTDVDPSLNVFPWQNIDGNALPAGSTKTQPRLS
jgi:hypothetical protein